jgi:hypothetical protein
MYSQAMLSSFFLNLCANFCEVASYQKLARGMLFVIGCFEKKQPGSIEVFPSRKEAWKGV